MLGGGVGWPHRVEEGDSDGGEDIFLALSPSRAKSQLQQLLQQNGLPLPRYSDYHASGPPHQRIFTSKLEIFSVYDTNKVVWEGSARGRTKKEAESAVASKGLQFIQGKLDCDQLHLLCVRKLLY